MVNRRGEAENCKFQDYKFSKDAKTLAACYQSVNLQITAKK